MCAKISNYHCIKEGRFLNSLVAERTRPHLLTSSSLLWQMTALRDPQWLCLPTCHTPRRHIPQSVHSGRQTARHAAVPPLGNRLDAADKVGLARLNSYPAMRQDVAREMGENEAAAKLIVVRSMRQLLIHFPSFPLSPPDAQQGISPFSEIAAPRAIAIIGWCLPMFSGRVDSLEGCATNLKRR